MEPRVKICGLTRREDVQFAEKAGADFVGAVMVPSSPRAVDPERARGLFEGLDVATVAVVADLEPAALALVAETVHPTVLQLHGDETPEAVEAIRSRSPSRIWKAVAVRGPEDVEAAVDAFGSLVDGLVLDAWDPKYRGGTGRQFPWEEVRSAIGRLEGGPIFIAAGGLAPHNVREAINVLRPAVVDVSSGVESRPGVKDQELVKRFIREARSAESGGVG